MIIVIFAYFFLAIVAVGDKYLLTGSLNPKTYTFYAGAFGAIVFLLIPFVNFYIPSPAIILVSFLAGAVFVLATFIFYSALEDFEVSRVVPAVGGLMPIFTLVLVFLLFEDANLLKISDFLALALLILGTFLITKGVPAKISLKSFLMAGVSAFLFSAYFVLSKYLYNLLPFWSAIILIRFGAFVSAMFFIFAADVRAEIFGKRPSSMNIRTAALFGANQTLAATGVILQNFSIAVAGTSYLAIINATEGIRYVFVFIFSIIISLKFPNILKEEMSRKIIIQKLIAIFLIVGGLGALAL